MRNCSRFNPQDDGNPYGRRLAVYRPSSGILSRLAITAFIQNLSGLLLLGGAIAIFCSSSHWLLLFSTLPLMTIVLLGILFILSGFICIMELVHNIGLQVEIYPSGFLFLHLWKTTYYGWNEILFVQKIGAGDVEQASRKTLHCYSLPSFEKYIIKCKDNRQCFISYSLANFIQLGELIESETNRRLLPKAIDGYFNGCQLDFGALKLSVYGWMKNGQGLPWSEVDGITVDNCGWFIIQRKLHPVRRWFGTSINKIHNYHVLINLLHDLNIPVST